MAVDEKTWTFCKDLLGYTDEELEEFEKNPNNENVVSKAPALTDRGTSSQRKARKESA